MNLVRRGLLCRGGCDAAFLGDIPSAARRRNAHEVDEHGYHHVVMNPIRPAFSWKPARRVPFE